MNQEKIGKFIAKLRKEKNMTQQELSNKIGVTDRAVSKWENGRGLPDISLIQPLCVELDISINELLSGERLKKEEYQEKLEENILNTISYSSKINKTHKKFKIIVAVIFVLLITISTMFFIDVRRMNKNKPVLFSTWGFYYTPALNIEEKEIYSAIKKYIVDESDNDIKYHKNEKSFASMRVFLLDEKESNKLYYVYAWVLGEDYYVENNKLRKDGGYSIPHKFKVEKINGEYKVTESIIPSDGSYEEDMKKIFPKSIRKDVQNSPIDGTVDKLIVEVEEQAKLYFHINDIEE